MTFDVGTVAKRPMRLEEAEIGIVEQVLRASRRDAKTGKLAIAIGEVESRRRSRIGCEARLRSRSARPAHAIGGVAHVVIGDLTLHARRGVIRHHRDAEIGIVVPVEAELHIVRLDVRHIDEGDRLGRLRAYGTIGQHAVAIDRIVSDETLRFALSEGEFDRGLARVDLQVRVEILRADLELVGRAVVDADRGTPAPAILVAVGDVAIFGRVVIRRHGRGVAASFVEGPVAAIVAAQHIDVIVRLFVAEGSNDPEAVVEIVAEDCGARRLPTRNLAALAALDVAGQREALLEVERIARLEVDDPAKPAFEQRCIGRFEDLDPADQFRRHAFETVVTVIIAFADLVDLEAADEELAVQ